MSERARAQRTKRARDERADDARTADATEAPEQGERLKAELDDLLDEIDDVLETNAEDFVKSYVQKGGE
ncbi:MAG: ubiquitin-like protein Pup [Acidimicrobiia bacterium]